MTVKYLEIPDELYDKCEEPMEEYGYSSFSEFAKDSIRKRVRELKE